MYYKKLVGDRIYLSPKSENDIQKYTEWLNDFEVTDHIGRSPFLMTELQEKEWVENADDIVRERFKAETGSKETDNREFMVLNVDLMLEMNHAFSEQGCRTYPHIVVDGMHCEATWETIVPVFLKYLYPEIY